MKPRILFVDDEGNILQGLRRMLRSMRSEWEMDFAEGGEAALAKFAESPFDVLVTDMKMPGINGAELLDRICADHPGTLRFILSGEADTEATFRTVATSHQFLPKPSNSERLIEVVRAGLKGRDSLAEGRLRSLVSSVACLPVGTASFDALRALAKEEAASIDEAAEVFAGDPALAAKVMQLANSAYFGIGDPVASPDAAVKLLGLDVLRALLNQESLIAPCPDGPCQALYEQTNTRARDVGDLAAWIAAQQGAGPVEAAQSNLVGLLHSLGRLLLISQAPADYARVLALIGEGKVADDAEQAVFSNPHTDVGACLAELWGLPTTVVESIRYLPRPSESPLPDGQQGPLLAAHAACGIIAGAAREPSAADETRGIDSDFMARHGCEAKIGDWTEGWRRQGSAA